MHHLRLLAIAAAVCGLHAAAPAVADNAYPSKTIRMVVGFPPGGISDVLARAVAAEASKQLGQSIVVENRPGAGTTIASNVVAQADADGYTLLFQDLTTHAINASLYTKLRYDSLKDFTPVAVVSSTPLLLVVNSESPATTVQQLVERAKAKPGDYSYGSSGNGTIIHLAGDMMNRATGIDLVHIPYKGSAGLVTSVLSGDIEYAFSSMPPALSQIQAGKLRALAVTTPARNSALPDVPTIAEAGVPQAEVTLYSGVLAPANLPEPVLTRLNDAFVKAVQTEASKTAFANQGATPMMLPPQGVSDLLKQETERYQGVVKATGLQLD